MTIHAQRLRKLGDACAALALLIGATGLLGWLLDVRALRSVLPSWVQMKANTAIGLSAAGLALLLTGRGEPSPRWRFTAARICAGLVLAIGALTLLEYHLPVDFGIDQLLFREAPGEISTASPGRMAQISAVCFLLTGLALLWRRGPSQWLSLLVGAIGLVGLLGYLLGIETTLPGDYLHMAVHTAVAFLALGVALLCANPGGTLMALASSAGPGGALVRRLYPAMIATLLGLAWVRQQALHRGMLGPETAVSTLLFANILALSIILFVLAEQIDGNELRFRQSFESPMAGKAIWTADGRVLDANTFLLGLLGRTKDEVARGELRCEHLPLPASARGRFGALVGLGPAPAELRGRSGETLSVLVSASEPAAGVGSYFLLDVSDRKRADDRLRKLQADDQERRVHQLQQALAGGISGARGFDDSLGLLLRTVADSTGASYAEAWLPGANGLSRSPHCYQADALFEPLRKSGVAEPDAALVRAASTGQLVWVTDLDAAGCPRAAQAFQVGLRSAAAVPVLAGDELTAVLLFGFRDGRTEDVRFSQVVATAGLELVHALRRKRDEEALRASELRFRSVAQSASDAIVSLDERGTVTSWNRAAEQIFGRAEAEMVGRSLELIIPERFREAHRKGLARMLGGAVYSLAGQRIELAGLRGDGSEFPIELSMGAWSTPQGRFFTGILRDIEGRKRAELELRKVNDGLRRTVGELEQRNREAAELGMLAEMLQSCSSVDDAARVLADAMPRLLPASAGALFLAHPDQQRFESASSWGPAAGIGSFAAGDCWALRRARLHRGGDGGRVSCAHAGAAGEARVCVGLFASGEALGVLTLRWPGGAPPAGDPALDRVLAAATDQIELALANLKLRDTLRMQAVRDPLTGLYNRRHLEESLDRELRRAQRKSRNLSLIICDVDHFKRLNDTHGHALGDVVLREVARTLQGAVRGDDVVCRYGGEEFVVILPEAGLIDAVRRAEDMRQLVRGLRIGVGGDATAQVTLSFGVASHPTHGADAASLLGMADAALYRAKAEGRDRVVAAAATVAVAAA